MEIIDLETTFNAKTGYQRIAGKIPVEEIIPLIDLNQLDQVPIRTIPIHVHSLRLQNFKKHGTNCVTCGIKGKHFSIERSGYHIPKVNKGKKKYKGYHLNLYAHDKNGKEVLMTQDHKLARSLGGKDSIENLQPMCSKCNNRKSKVEYVILNKINSRKQFVNLALDLNL